MRMNSVGSLAAAILMACVYCCLVAGCGYRLAGTGRLPADVDTLFISMFENRSSLIGIENDFTGSLIQEFTRRRAGSLVEENEADAVFSGVITSISTANVSYRDKYTAVQRRVRVRLSARLVSPDGRTVWAADNINGNEVYTVETEKFATDQNLRAAVKKLAGDLAERVYNQMTANF